MHLLFRTLLHLFLSYRRTPLSLWGHSSIKLRAWPADIDLYGHVNNGRYFSLMDLGRVDLMIRSGIWKKLQQKGWRPVMSAETISFRKSLKMWQRYTMESRLIGFDDRAMYFEQCMVVSGEIYVRAFMAMRVVGGGKPVTNQELFEVIGQPPADLVLPEWLHGWRSDVSLPGTRKPAPFNWSSLLPKG
ncbi:acyl-CoA thioesterase [Psychromicrobium sp. YIM B11713]|uniref:acyl-CoA thioesterase n=1 Tax=Psychromicrobium sp. YIM B11713 TaxID=3145233 RepID=UPI00374E6BB6